MYWGSGGDKNKDNIDNINDKHKFDEIDKIMLGKLSKEDFNKSLESILDTMLKLVADNMKDHPDTVYKYLKTWEVIIQVLYDILNMYQSIEGIIDITEKEYPNGIADLSQEVTMTFLELVLDRDEAQDPIWVCLSVLKTIKSMLLWLYNANMVFAKLSTSIFKELMAKAELTKEDIRKIKEGIYKQYRE